jgi:hypothetical protein
LAPKEQLRFLEVFETSRAPNALFCHQEFLEKLAEHGRDTIGRRAAFLMQRLSVDARRLHYKATQGVNHGWRDHGWAATTAAIFTLGGLPRLPFR